MSAHACHPGRRAREALHAQDATAAIPGLPHRLLPHDASRGERERTRGGDEAARVPHELLHHVRDRGRVHPRGDVLAHQHGDEPRGGHRDGLLQQARAHAAAAGVPHRGAARGRRRAWRAAVGGLHRHRPDRGGTPAGGRRRRPRRRPARVARRRRVRIAWLRRRAEDRLGGGCPGPVPAVLRVHLPVVQQPAKAAAEDGLVSHDRDVEPYLLPHRGLQGPLHLRLGRRTLWRGFAVAIGLLIVGLFAVALALRGRLQRT